ncbi:hypothetical protein CHS0354_016345 [Potamilus streckersoni]|uniref:Aminopeptidase n=1 Tax=Potamilus streckersoni TaxID=2493646 RepID=A0AAE0SN14_9BIVA|nr:hypothetical protein CHS0354_016345 [Potamilus streckersoni]
MKMENADRNIARGSNCTNNTFQTLLETTTKQKGDCLACEKNLKKDSIEVILAMENSNSNLNINQCNHVHMKETVVTLHSTSKSCIFTRIQVTVFAVSFLLTIALLVLLLIFLGGQRNNINSVPTCRCEEDKQEGNLTYKVDMPATISTISAFQSSDAPVPGIRLPRNLDPVHYDLKLEVNLAKGRYSGCVRMLIHVVTPTRYIVFHSSDFIVINKNNITVTLNRNNSQVEIVQHHWISESQFYILEAKSELLSGSNYTVDIKSFGGFILPDLKGIYISSYKTNDGETRYLAASQLQSTDARKVFPCFDEPDMKATFSVTIIHQTGFRALSNMPPESTTCIDDCSWQKVKFKTTPRMSTYLLAFVISDFQFRETMIFDNYQLRVWAQPEMYNQTEYALEFASKCYEFFTEYFGIPDVVPKADHVAVPDFSAGAMENWGLVIYRETALLYDPNVSSSSNKYTVTFIVAHEIAHTWFGNMVTMKWWDDLWLNEGFANVLMYIAMDDILHDWKVFSIQVVEDMFPVMLKDALKTSHPISTPINHPDDIAQYFDHISYNKGMAVLRMLGEFLGWNVFREGLKMYITKYKFKNAEMSELWQTFTEATNGTIDVGEIMDTWTRQMGYPVVTVREEANHYILEQSRFLLDENSSESDNFDSPYGYKWHVPVTYVLQENPDEKYLVWLHLGPATLPRLTDGWLLGNIDYVGFFKVNYEVEMWQKLADQLNTNHLVFRDSNRAGLIGDSFNFARAAILDYSVALNLSTYLHNETSYVPWKAFVDATDFIRGMLTKQSAYVLLEKYIRQLIAPVFASIGTNDTGSLPERYLRRVLLRTGCEVGVQEAINYATFMFHRWMKNGTRLPSDYSKIIYSVGIREGNVEEWDHVWNKSQSTNVAAERDMMLDALAQTQKPWLLWRYADWLFDSNKIKRQDVRLVMSYFSQTPLGRMIALHFLMNRWDELNKQFGRDTFLLREVIAEVTQFVNSEFELKQLETLFREKPPKIARKETENALALIRANIKWMNNNYEAIATWLQQRLNISM